MPVGPGEQELARCRAAVGSLRREPAVQRIVLIDDTDGSDRLAVVDGSNVVTLPHPLRGRKADLFDRITVATLAGVGWAAEHDTADFIMKLDTDALVIAPFVEKLVSACAQPDVGMTGSYDVNCNGEPRSFDSWSKVTKRATRLIQPRRLAISTRARRARRFIREARDAGYVWGEHPLACAVALTRGAVDVMRREGCFVDPLTFIGTGLGDDPVLGILVRRAGFRTVGNVRNGETFAVAWRGLPDSPSRLAERGYSIIHSVKNDARFSEQQIVDYFESSQLFSEPRS